MRFNLQPQIRHGESVQVQHHAHAASAFVLPHLKLLMPFPLDPQQTRAPPLCRNGYLKKFTDRAPEVKRGVAPHAGPPGNENGESTGLGRPEAFAPVIIGGAHSEPMSSSAQMSETMSSDDNLQAELSREIDEIRSRYIYMYIYIYI